MIKSIYIANILQLKIARPPLRFMPIVYPTRSYCQGTNLYSGWLRWTKVEHTTAVPVSLLLHKMEHTPLTHICVWLLVTLLDLMSWLGLQSTRRHMLEVTLVAGVHLCRLLQFLSRTTRSIYDGRRTRTQVVPSSVKVFLKVPLLECWLTDAFINVYDIPCFLWLFILKFGIFYYFILYLNKTFLLLFAQSIVFTFTSLRV